MRPVAKRGLITIEGHMLPAVFRYMAQIPGYKKWIDEGQGGCRFAATRTHVDLWRQMFPDVEIEDVDGSIAKLYSELTPVAEAPRALDYRGLPAQPAQHQNRAHNVMQARECYGFFHDMGTYKSATITQGIGELFAARKIDRAIVVTTKRGLPQFLTEQLPMWMPKGIKWRAAQLSTPTARKRFMYPKDDLLIGFCTPGAFQSKKQIEQIVEFAKGGVTGVFIDESQNFKGWSNLRVDSLLKLKPHAARRYLFSGEPEPNGYEDLFAQFYFMDENILGHASLTSFQKDYCVFGGYEIKQIVDYKNVERLAASIAPHCEYLKIEDCIDMPSRAWGEIKYEPTQQQLDLYQQLKKEFIILVTIANSDGDPEVVKRSCKNAASKFTVMQQISNGWFYKDFVEEGSPREIVRITHDRALFTLEEGVGSAQKCIIWARFHADLEQLRWAADELGIDAVEFSGRLSDKQCEHNKLRFQNDPKCRVFFGTAASGGEALNLQVCKRTVYHSNTFNWGHRIQSERRTWRGGQSEHCQYYDIIGLPIDRLLRRNARDKEDTAAQLCVATRMAQLALEL